MTEFMYFVLGALVSIPVSILSPFFTDRIRRRRAGKNRELASKRIAELKAKLDLVQGYRSNNLNLLVLIGRELLIINVLWVSVEAVEWVITFALNLISGYNEIAQGPFYVRVGLTENITYAIYSIIAVILLTIVMRRSSRIARLSWEVHNFEKFERGIMAQIDEFQKVAAIASIDSKEDKKENSPT